MSSPLLFSATASYVNLTTGTVSIRTRFKRNVGNLDWNGFLTFFPGSFGRRESQLLITLIKSLNIPNKKGSIAKVSKSSCHISITSMTQCMKFNQTHTVLEELQKWTGRLFMKPTGEAWAHSQTEGHVWKVTPNNRKLQANPTPPWDALESDSLHRGYSSHQSNSSSDKWAGSTPLFYTLLILLWALIDRDAVDFIISFGCGDAFSQTSVSLGSVYQRNQRKQFRLIIQVK